MILGGSMWFARNLAHRIIRKATWRKLVAFKQSLLPDKRTPLVQYGQHDYQEVYVSQDQKGNWYGFVWDWQNEERKIPLAKMLELYDKTVKNSQTSWEQRLMEQQRLLPSGGEQNMQHQSVPSISSSLNFKTVPDGKRSLDDIIEEHR
jgi:hypothetical protein